MNSRITLVSILEKEDILKIEELLSQIEKPLCKVPFGKGVEDRILSDTLPYHFTIYSWDIKKEEKVIDFLKNVQFPKLELTLNCVNIMRGNENSYVLYLGIEKNNQLEDLQNIFYQQFGSEYYNPDCFEFHITLHITKDKQEVTRMREELEKKFQPFSCTINRFGLYEIYPANLVYTCNNMRCKYDK